MTNNNGLWQKFTIYGDTGAQKDSSDKLQIFNKLFNSR